jgi:hypothetical protein
LIGDDPWYGDGSDGDVTISVNTTLTRDMVYNNLTVDVGVVLSPDGYRIFVKGTLTNNGTIRRNGNAGAVNNGLTATRVLGGSQHGGTRGITASPGGPPTANDPDQEPTIGGNGGDGGAGSTSAGGTGAVPVASTVGEPRALPFLMPICQGITDPSSRWWGGVSGCGGGGATGVAGGFAGSGGGVILIAARTIVNTGTIQANGGVGASGSAGGGGSGAGGGGGGGFILLIYRSLDDTGTIEAAGGAGGAIGAGFSAGSAGSTGTIIELFA